MAARSDGARQWAAVLSDLAGVPVTVEWERPAWRVRWTDGPTRQVLVDLDFAALPGAAQSGLAGCQVGAGALAQH